LPRPGSFIAARSPSNQGRWREAVDLREKAKPIMTGLHRGSEPERSGAGKALLAQNTYFLRAYARALYRSGAREAAYRAEGFELAQWALQNEAARFAHPSVWAPFVLVGKAGNECSLNLCPVLLPAK
jgi:hypothetical protein